MSAPYFFTDAEGEPGTLSPARYLASSTTYRFPLGHRLAGGWTAATTEPMRRDLFRLFVRLDYHADAFRELVLRHGVTDLSLPFGGPHVKMTGGWLYSDGTMHTGLDFNDEPNGQHPYPDHRGRTNFDVYAAADGTVAGWDGVKLLTLEHESSTGRRFRTQYNMLRNVPVRAPAGGIVELGMRVSEGETLGQVWDPPGNPIHLHFALAIPHHSTPGWTPDLTRLFPALLDQFDLSFTPTQQAGIRAFLGPPPWPPTEWFMVDPFGRFDISNRQTATYGPVARGLYYPVPPGVGTNAFAPRSHSDHQIAGAIPLVATHARHLDRLSVQPVDMGTMVALAD